MRATKKTALDLYERDMKRRNLAPRTTAFHLWCVKRFLGSLRGSLEAVNATKVKTHLAGLAERVCENTVARELSTLRGFFRCLVEAKLVEHDPTEGLDAARGTSRPPLLLGEETVRKLLVTALEAPRDDYNRPAEVRTAISLRDRACVELLYGLGLRASEVAGAMLIDVSMAEGTLRVRRAKRGVSSCYSLPPAALPFLERYLREGRPQLVQPGGEDRGHFLVGQYGRPLTSALILVLVRRLARRIGVRAHPHAFRRALATHLVRDGASVVAVQDLLGHVNLATTALYCSVDRAELHRAVAHLEHG